MSDFNMFRSRILNWIFSKIYDTSVITSYGCFIKFDTKIFELLLNPQDLSTTTSGCNVFDLGRRQYYRILFLTKPGD